MFKMRKKIIYCFDSDEAGLKAAWRALQISLKNVFDDRTVRFLFLPENYDPDSFIKEHGQEEFAKKLERSMVLESFTYQYLKRGMKLDSPEDVRKIIFEFKKLIPMIRSETLKETLLQKISTELNINKDILLKEDAPDVKPIFKTQKKIEKKNYENELLLLIFILENFANSFQTEANEFYNFVQGSKNQEIIEIKDMILGIKEQDVTKKQTPLFTKAMMIDLKLTKEEAYAEFIRASDVIRLEYDESFADYLINLAKKKQLTTERKENLQKLLNLRDNNSIQEEELIQDLNKYS